MNKLTNLRNEAQKISLSHEEKVLMRTRIFGETSPAAPSYLVSYHQWFSMRFVPALAAVLVLLLGGGTAYAAQGAVPGDLLYAIKVNVNEPVREALAVSTEAKAAFYKDVTEARLEEAETLAAEGRLDAEAGAQIEQSLDEHLAQAEEINVKLEEEDKEDLAGEFSAELDSTLSAHGSILAKLGEESENQETKERGIALASRITSRVFGRAGVGVGATMALKVAAPTASTTFMATNAEEDTSTSFATMSSESATSGSEVVGEADKRMASQLQSKVEAALQDAHDTLNELEGSVDATTTARVEAQLAVIEDQFDAGKDLYDEEEYTEARSVFSAALRDITELNAYMRAEQKFNKKLLRSWIDDRFGNWFEKKTRTDVHSDDGGSDEEEGDTEENDENGENGDDSTDHHDQDADDDSLIRIDATLDL